MIGIQKTKRETSLSSSSCIRGLIKKKTTKKLVVFFDILKKMVITYHLTHQ